MSSHYETLGVPEDADAVAIKKAYRRKARENHPDRQGGDHKDMVAVNRAYQTLSDPKRREHYDASGEDRPDGADINSAEMNAMQMVWSILSQVIDHVEDADWIDSCRKQLKDNIRGARRTVAELAKKQTRYERQMKKVRRKSEGENLVIMVWQQRIDSIISGVADGNEQIALAEKAIEMLNDYESPYEAPSQFQPMTIPQTLLEAMRKAQGL
jgi:DnaJ-domain-containing protein 1